MRRSNNADFVEHWDCSGIVLICVGTPIDDRGHADTSAVELVLGELSERATAPIVVVRSTLPVGTCERLLREGAIRDTTRFFTVPEFLRQGAALADFRHPNRVVIGCPANADPEARDALVDLLLAFDAPMLVVTLEESELIKNGANAGNVQLQFASGDGVVTATIKGDQCYFTARKL